MSATERIPVLVSAEEKLRIAERAKRAGMSMGEFLRKAADAYNTDSDDIALSTMIDQMVLATDRAEAAVDKALASIEESENRIAEMEANYRANIA